MRLQSRFVGGSRVRAQQPRFDPIVLKTDGDASVPNTKEIRPCR